MGTQTRREREKEKRRQDILEAAKSVFSLKGYNKATMEEIAKKAELSSGTIYLYFKSKSELHACLSIYILKCLNQKLESINNDINIDPELKLDQLKDILLELYDFDPHILLNMFNLQSSKLITDLSPDVLAQLKDLSRNPLMFIAKIIEDGINSNKFIEKHPRALADIIWAIFTGVVLLEDSKKRINSNKNFLKQTLEIAFDVFKRGIRK